MTTAVDIRDYDVSAVEVTLYLVSCCLPLEHDPEPVNCLPDKEVSLEIASVGS